MIERFKLSNGVLQPPARNAVAADGRVFSNFDLLVARDAVFAAQNGYYPKTTQAIPQGEGELVWLVSDGMWQARLEPFADESLSEGEM